MEGRGLRTISNGEYFFIFRKDVRLPVHLQRAMATEAEAAREARAKVLGLIVLEIEKFKSISLHRSSQRRENRRPAML